MRLLSAGVLLVLGCAAMPAATMYNVNVSSPLTTGGPGTIFITGFLTVNDANFNNVVDAGEITDLSLMFSTSNSAATHTLLFANANIDIMGSLLGISGGQLVIRSTTDLVLDSVNFISFGTSSPNPNSALLSISAGRLDFSSFIRHTQSVQYDLNGPAPNFDTIGQALSVVEQDDTPVNGFALSADVPEPATSCLLLVGLAAIVWKRTR